MTSGLQRGRTDAGTDAVVPGQQACQPCCYLAALSGVQHRLECTRHTWPSWLHLCPSPAWPYAVSKYDSVACVATLAVLKCASGASSN